MPASQTLPLSFNIGGAEVQPSPKALREDFPYPCRVTEEDSISFHRNGSFAICTAAERVTVAGVKFNAGDHIMVDEKGQAIADQSRFSSFAQSVLGSSMEFMELFYSADDIYNNYW